MNPEDRIKITYYNPVADDRSQVIANFGCHIVKQDLYFAKLKLIYKKNGGLFIAPPSEKYIDPKTGKEAYGNFFWYGAKNNTIFQEMCLESIKSYCLRKGLTLPTLSQCSSNEMPSSASSFQDIPPTQESQGSFEWPDLKN